MLAVLLQQLSFCAIHLSLVNCGVDTIKLIVYMYAN